MSRLFYGFLLTTQEEQILKNSEKSVFFIQKDPLYLQFLQFKDGVYLGKFLQQELDNLVPLELLESHLISVLNQLISNHKKKPVLIGIHCEE